MPETFATGPLAGGGQKLSLSQHSPRGQICRGRRLCPLSCGDRRDLPLTPNGSLTIADHPENTPGIESSAGAVLFEAGGLQYSIENRGGHVMHVETRRAASGEIVAQTAAEVQFTVGSGRQARGYLIERDGFMFQSPITRYVQRERWDLSPGFEKRNLHFERPVDANCLYCHANRVENVAGTLNRYERPIFQGYAIGCERCHGPGELHVQRPTIVDGRDVTIVNPGALGLRCVMRSASNVT